MRIACATLQTDRSCPSLGVHLPSLLWLRGGVILSDSTLTVWLENGTSVTIKRNQIGRMGVPSGTRSLKGAALGGGIGLTLWLIPLVEEALDPNTDRPD